MTLRRTTALAPLALLLGACSPQPAASTNVSAGNAASGNGPAQCQHSDTRQIGRAHV